MADRLSVRSTRELPCYILKKDWWRRERVCAGHKQACVGDANETQVSGGNCSFSHSSRGLIEPRGRGVRRA